jgi:RP/EB family microtubule-associated protein
VLQNAFDKNGIKRHIETSKLVKARPLDNLEFCQWLKAYFEKNYNGEPYDALGRRKNQDLHYILGGNKVGAPSKPSAAASQPAARAAPRAAPSASAAGSSSMTGLSKPIGGGAASAASAAEIKKLND